MNILDKLYDSSRANKLDDELKNILDLDKTYKSMTDDELKAKSRELMERAQNGEKEDSLMTEAFALVREATFRTLGMKQYPVQLKGGISIAKGNLAEMATGEGKTIVVPLVAYLHALSGKNVHVVTSNDYLAKRDSEQMEKLFGFLGMSVGLSAPLMSTEQKQLAYSKNITYTTATELGFDYLRDNSLSEERDKVLRGLNSIVIDEADHTLLDEASTPLILAKEEKISKDEKAFLQAVAAFVDDLVECKGDAYDKNSQDGDYFYDQERQTVSFSEKGIERLEKFFMVDNIFDGKKMELLKSCNNALKAKVLFKKDINYVVRDGKIQIVGESTGRILDGRKYSHGIQQAIESKEGIEITPLSRTQSNINFQNFFKLYDNLGGMSGTCKTDQDELEKIYGLRVDKIDTNKPLIRTDEHFKFFHSTQTKNQAMKERIMSLHQVGRPILIGTSSVEKSEELAVMLDEMGLKYNIINAKNDEEESKIIAQAGKASSITIATNMAGRGTDIKLGGNPTFMAQEEMKKLGFSPALISFADSFLQPKNEQEKQAREKFDELKSRFKKQTDEEKIEVMKLGGLAVIGTVLNSSKRVDNQLRGRAGRQGEPGSSEIFVSWDDVRDTFKIGPDSEENYLKVLKKKKIDTSKEITDKSIISTIEDLQSQAQAQARAARESNYKLNTPENLQRIAIYSEKEEIIKICDNFDVEQIEFCNNPSTDFEKYLFGLYQDDISQIVDELMCGINANSSNTLHPHDNFKKSCDDLRGKLQKYGFGRQISDQFLKENMSDPQQIKNRLSVYALKFFKKAIMETKGYYKNINNILKTNILSQYDKAWGNHLERLEQAKFQLSISQSTNPNALNDFCKDSYHFFHVLQDNVREEIISSTSQIIVNCVLKVRAIQNLQTKNSDQTQTKSSLNTDVKNKNI